MCHLVLLLPVVGLPLFWLAPLYAAGPVYALNLFLSVWLYWLIMRSWRQPVESGVEQLRRASGRVVDVTGKSATVRVRNELWKCKCREKLSCGDTVKVLDVDGLTLRVEKISGREAALDKTTAVRPNGAGAIS